MNVIEQARQAYAPAHTATRTDRSIEAQLISQITARLRQAQINCETAFPALVTALHENRRMWTAMAADVADGANALPQELRAQIFYLAEFTDHHSQLVIRGKATAEALIDVNMAVMKGLNGQRAA
ncbi:flagellar biosynthesis regulator FlaF [Yoonia sp.]|uniref:flagellar biosynthesis regulator FlaF n=1 Tax=Yoonia sp. TaxID=2212373 RepID=UPI0035C8197F